MAFSETFIACSQQETAGYRQVGCESHMTDSSEPSPHEPNPQSAQDGLTLDWHIDDNRRRIATDSFGLAASTAPARAASEAAIVTGHHWFYGRIMCSHVPNRLGNRQLTDESVDYFVVIHWTKHWT